MEKNNAAEKAILRAIVVQPSRVDATDIEAWKSAVNNAKRGNRTALYNLYENLLSDPVLSEAVESRIEAITNAEITFQVDGKNIEEIDDLIDTPEFEELIREIALQRAWGKSVIDTSFDPEFTVFPFPRKNVRIRGMEKPRSEWKKYIAVKESDQDGYDYTQDEFIIECGKDDDLGYLWKAAQYVIYKRGNFGDWAQFAEIFGMPFLVGRYNSHDTTTRDQLYEALGEIGGKPFAAIPTEANIEFHENKSSGSNDLYNALRRACNEEILIAVKGNTMTTLDGSSRAQAEVHADAQSGKTKSDRRYVQRVLNKHFVPLLIKRGYPVAGGFFLFPEQGEKMKVSEQVDLGLKLRNAGIPVADNYFYEITGIPASEKDEPTEEKKNKGKEEEQPTEPEPGTAGKKDDKPAKKTKLFDRFFAFAPTKERGFSGRLMKLSDSEDLNERVISRINGEDTFDIELYEYFNARLFEAVQTHLKLSDTAFVYGQMDDAYKTAMEINLFHFSAAKTIAEITELNRLFRQSKSFEEFYKEAIKVTDVFNRRWMETEYETALLVAESASNYWRLRSKSQIFPYWQYTAVMDGRTRESHAALHGIILPANDERWKKITPPNGWKCRCRIKAMMKHELPKGYNFEEARAIVDEYLESDEWKSIAAQGWDTNRAETAEVFTKTQQYINKFPEKGGKFLDDLTAQKWGQETVPALIKKAPAEMPVTKLTAAEIWDKYAKDEVIKLQLFNERNVTLTKRNFIAHTTAKKDNRTLYFDAMREALQNPDELWLNNEHRVDRSVFRRWIVGGKKDDKLAKRLNYDNFNAIKYYNDGAVVVNYRITNGQLEVKTWYSLQMKKHVWDRHRRGLFIKQKKSSR